MFWRAEIWQQLLQYLNRIYPRIVHPARAGLGIWPGLITLALLLVAITTSLSLFGRASIDASAQVQSSSASFAIESPSGPAGESHAGLTQIASRTPTRRATASATTTATATPRPPTPTWTPLATATQVANSPLQMSPTRPFSATATHTATHTVPRPSDMAGPQIIPVDVITATKIASATPAETDVTKLLVPTPTPVPALSGNETLEPPVASAGLAGLVATATAAMPVDDFPTTEPQAVADAEPVSNPEATAEPLPVATVVSQPTPDGSAHTAQVPILMYHYLSVPPAGADIYRQDLSVTPELFAAHLDAMQQAGYTPITLYALLEHLTYGAPLPEKPVILTFDDGYRDNYANAFPLLRERGITATFFIVTDFINDQRPEYLSWDMVREMHAAGMSIEGHGRNHVSLANKDNDYLVWQALGTYESIEHEIGVRPRFISYPAGEYDQRTMDIFRSAGYWAGFTTRQGATHNSDDLFQLRRIRVRGSTSPTELLRLLALDW